MNVFCDSDGVLFDFDSHLMSYTNGISPNKLGDDKMWELIKSIPEFWITMPLFPWAHELINFLRPYHPIILTGCPKNNFEYAAEQKKLKYVKHFPDISVITCLSKEKAFYMQTPGDILIDDMPKNIKRWVIAGGRGIRFRTYDQTIADFSAMLLFSNQVVPELRESEWS